MTAPPDAEVRLPEWVAPAQGDELRWREGYVAMRLGDHAWAWAAWDLVRDPAVLPRVAVSRGASLRELGRHDLAEVEDERALATASLPVTAAARIGLVADAVGQGDAAVAQTRLVRASAAVDALSDDLTGDRQRIRLGWVEVEVALLTGAPVTTELPSLERGEANAPPWYRAGSVHHLAKGLLFRGVAERDQAALDHAAAIAPPGLRWAVELARADLGASDAPDRAREAWRAIRTPPGLDVHTPR